jgi:hypothetical protein
MNTHELNYNPESCGMELVAEIELSDGCYQFSTVCVWRELSTGKLWGAHDSGCSCPTPFEDHTWPTDFTEIVQPIDAIQLVVTNTWGESPYPSSGERLDFGRKIDAALREKALTRRDRANIRPKEDAS